MWLNKKLRIIQDEKWVVVKLKLGYAAATFPMSSTENFYKFIASLKTDPIGIYKIEITETGMPNTTYVIGETADPNKKIWKYDREQQQLFFATLVTFSGTPETKNKITDEIHYDLVLEKAIATTNGFTVYDGDSGVYGPGEVLNKSYNDSPFKYKGKNLRWESGYIF